MIAEMRKLFFCVIIMIVGQNFDSLPARTIDHLGCELQLGSCPNIGVQRTCNAISCFALVVAEN